MRNHSLLLVLVILLPALGATAQTTECPNPVDDPTRDVHLQLAAIGNHGWAGLDLTTDENGRLSVAEVIAGGPGQAAGIQVGDVLVSINGIPVNNGVPTVENFEALRVLKRPGQTLTYTVDRRGQTRAFQVTLKPLPEAQRLELIRNTRPTKLGPASN